MPEVSAQTDNPTDVNLDAQAAGESRSQAQAQAPQPPQPAEPQLALPANQVQPGPAAKLTGLQKAAVLIVALGQEKAAKVLKYLTPDDVELLATEVARTNNVSPEIIDAVMQEVVETAMARGYFHEGGLAYARDLLESSLGPERASEILSRLQAMIEVRPFRFLLRTPPDQIYNFIRREHPQVIAVILAHLNEHQAADVLELMEPELQGEVIRRIANMRQTSPDLIAEIERVVRSKMGALMGNEMTSAGGVEAAAKLINQVDRQTERNVFSVLEQEDNELAEEIRKLLFVFEDLVKLDDRALQLVIRECDHHDIALALRMANDEVKDAIFRNMSERAADALREELELMRPQRRRDIEEAQQRIVAVVRRLEEEGEIHISRGEEDEVV